MATAVRSREHDEQVLGMVRCRALGLTLVTIAHAAGLNLASVGRATNAVRDADLVVADPSATPAEIRGAYW